MEAFMIGILNMSFAAGCTAFEAMIVKNVLEHFHLPKKYAYWLWMVVLFRFLCPFILIAPVSFLPVNPRPLRQEIVYGRHPEVLTGVDWLDDLVNENVMNSLAPESPAVSANPIQVLLWAGFILWAFGAAGFFLYHLYQLRKLKQLLSTSVPAGEFPGEREGKAGKGRIPVRISDRIDGAFTMGIFRPVIYLPVGLKEEASRIILHHEWIHIRRKDGLVKLLWMAAVMVHWFNPAAWLCFRRMCGDMEMSCDEQVLWEQGCGEKARYSKVLLDEAQKRNRLILPLAFGKSPVSRRIRNILAYRKPGKKALFAGGVIAAAASAGLLVSSGKLAETWKYGDSVLGTQEETKEADPSDPASVAVIGGADGPTSIFIAGKIAGSGENGSGEDEAVQVPEELLKSVRLVPHWDADSPPEGAVRVLLDFASEDMLIFHGAFGSFVFTRTEDGFWHQDLFVPAGEGFLAEEAQEYLPGQGGMSSDSIHVEDRLIGNGQDPGPRAADLAVGKMENGKIAVLGAGMEEDGTCLLKNLWYGYYDPGEQILHQVFLFLGDRRELVNQKGQIQQADKGDLR